MEIGVAFAWTPGPWRRWRSWLNRRTELLRKSYPGGEWIIELDRDLRPVFRDTGTSRYCVAARPVRVVDGRSFVRVEYEARGMTIADPGGQVGGPEVLAPLVFGSLQAEAFDIMETMGSGRRRRRSWVRMS